MIVTIKDAFAQASIDSLGAQLISYKDDTFEYIWQRNPNYWQNCSPLLFPIIGSIPESGTRIDDKIYHIPKHGFIKISDLQIISHKDDMVSFGLCDTEKTHALYPYKFHFVATYRLINGKLQLNINITNNDDKSMPFFIGTHPGINCPLCEGEKFEDYFIEFKEQEEYGYHKFDATHNKFDDTKYYDFPGDGKKIRLDYKLFDIDAIWFDKAKSRCIYIHNNKHGVKVSFPDYETVAFWTMPNKNAPYICVEPWNGSAQCISEGEEFTSKNHVQILEAKHSIDYNLFIEPYKK